ncbi:MAG: hypothetical protein ACE5FU_00625 [Nitrospinota bacterium]
MKRVKSFLFYATLFVQFIVFIGCGSELGEGENEKVEFNESGDTSEVTVDVVLPETSRKNKLGNELRDVSTLQLYAKWEGGSSDPAHCSTASGGEKQWKCFLSGLPSNISIALFVSAFDENKNEIFSGKGEARLSPGQTVRLAIGLHAGFTTDFDDHIPLVSSVTFSEEQGTLNTPLTLKIKVCDGDKDDVTLNYNSRSGGTFEPASDTLALPSSECGTVSTVYTPKGNVPYREKLTITLDDSRGLTSSFIYHIFIRSIDGGVGVTPNFPPDIFSIKSVVDGDITVFTAEVSDDQPLSELAYSWKIDDMKAGNTNPVRVRTPASGAVIHVTVSDRLGATRQYSITWGPNSVEPKLLVSPRVLSFGKVAVNQSKVLPLKVANVGGGDLKLGHISISSDKMMVCLGTGCPVPAPVGMFKIASNTCTDTVLPHESCFLEVSFSPTREPLGPLVATLTIPSNDGGMSSCRVPLSGIGEKFPLPPIKWLLALIKKLRSEPVANPPLKIFQYLYNGEMVYYLPPGCCDIFGNLYNKTGEIICHPGGGITGAGDGRCKDFFSSRSNEILIWRDKRTGALVKKGI